MPSYRVKSPGFYDGMLYSPGGKRRVVSTDKPLKPVPTWLEPMKAKDAKALEKTEGLLNDTDKSVDIKEPLDFAGNSTETL